MQDSGQGNGRDNKGRFAPGHTGNPNGRRGNEPEKRMDVRFDSLPGDQIDPERVLNLIRMDGWQNAATGMGVPGYDKRLGSRFINTIVSYTDLVELWRGDDICARVIETLPKEALQKGYELNIADEGEYGDLKDQVEQMVDDLELNDMLRTALMQERAYGGSALLIGANDGQDMSMPLNLETIMGLQYVTPLEPYEITPLSSYTDQLHPKYGKPELYQLNAVAQAGTGSVDPMSRCLPSTSVIHESRIIIFPGLRVSKFQSRSSVAGNYWGDSVLNRVIQVVADFNMGFASTGIILTEQGLPIFHMKELAKLVNANRLDIVKARLSLLFQQMSTARAAVIDAEENYERKAMPLTGLSDVLDRLCTRLAAAVEMPVTKLMGQSPKGLGNEGDSDMEQWYDKVASYQDEKIRRPLRRLLQIVMKALHLQEPLKWSIEFHPLMQQSDKEQADARAVQMTIDTGYLSSGVLTVEEIRNSRFSGKYSHETQLDDAAWAAMNATNQPLTPEDMMAMGLDPNNPDDVAQAQQMQAEQAGQMGGMDPNDPNAQMQIDPETGEPLAPEGEVDPETGEPIAPEEGEVDPETGEPLAPEGEELAEGEEKPAPFGAKPGLPGAKPVGPGAPKPGVPGAKPGLPGAKPAVPGAKPMPFGKAKPAAKPGEELPEGEEKPAEGGDLPEGEEKGKVLPFGKAKPAEGPEEEPGEEPVEGEEPAEGEEPVEGAEKPGDSPFANSEQKPGEIKDGGRGRSGETDEDRQRMASQRPGTPLHVIDRDKNGRISAQEAEEAGISLEDLMAQLDKLNQELNGGAKVPVQPDENGEIPIPTGEQEPSLVEGEEEEPVDGDPEPEGEEAEKPEPEEDPKAKKPFPPRKK